MINQPRKEQLLELMEKSGWDFLVLYGHAWRKDFLRTLVNFNFFGPQAAVALSRRGDISAVVSHPWDGETLSGEIEVLSDGGTDFHTRLRALARPKTAIAGIEFMEARFASLFPGVTSASLAVETLRRIKTADEIERIKRAIALADAGYRYFVETIQPGMAEYELVAEVEGFLKAHGAEDNFMLIASGGTEVFGMKPPTTRRFQIGDSVTTELSPQVDGYFAQICRTLVLGPPTEGQQRSFAIFREAQEAAERFLRPGVNIRDVARVQNDVFRREGFGEYTSAKYTRVRGHNLGLYPDENPYVLEDVDSMVEAGMVLIAHPNTYLPLSGYMVHGDTLIVTGDGCLNLSQTEKTLFVKEA